MVRRGNEARLRSPTKYGAARRGAERRGEATHPMLLLIERSASSIPHRNFYGGIGLSLVAVVSRESQWDWFDLRWVTGMDLGSLFCDLLRFWVMGMVKGVDLAVDLCLWRWLNGCGGRWWDYVGFVVGVC
jgi:hypothetical protein